METAALAKRYAAQQQADAVVKPVPILEVFTVTAKGRSRYAEGYGFKAGKHGNDTASGNISVFIHTICGEILADSKNSDEFCYEDAHMQGNGN